jgi:hypothetical protein
MAGQRARSRVVTGNGGGSIGGAARAAFMAGFDPADDTSRRRVLTPRVSGRSRDRRHRHDRTGTHAGWRSAQREIAAAQLAGWRPPAVSHVLHARRGHEPAALPQARRQCDAGAGDRQRRTGSARTGCSVPLSCGELAIDRPRIVGDMALERATCPVTFRGRCRLSPDDPYPLVLRGRMAGIRRKPGVENIHSAGGDRVARLAGAWVRALMVPRGGPRRCGRRGVRQ